MSDTPAKPTKAKPEPAKAEGIALDDLPPEKLAAFVRRLEEERDARTTAKVEAGEAVRIRVLQINRAASCCEPPNPLAAAHYLRCESRST
jgi:hypothetical protein